MQPGTVCVCVTEVVDGVWLTYMCATDAFQKQPCNLCLSIKLCLGHSELMFSLKKQEK